MSRLYFPRWTGCRLPHKVKHNLTTVRRELPSPSTIPGRLPTPPPPIPPLSAPSPNPNTHIGLSSPSPEKTRRIRPRLAIFAGKPGLANRPYSLELIRRQEGLRKRIAQKLKKPTRSSLRLRNRKIAEAAKSAVPTRGQPVPRRHEPVPPTPSPRRIRPSTPLGKGASSPDNHSPVKTYALRTRIIPTKYASDTVRQSFESRRRLAGPYRLRQEPTPSAKSTFDGAKARRNHTWFEYRRILKGQSP